MEKAIISYATLALPSHSPCLFSSSSSNSSFFNNSLVSKTRRSTSFSSSGLGLVLVRSRTRNRKRGLSCNCFFGLGVPELVVIAGVAALVFGPKKLPEVGRSIGKTVKGFQQAAKEFESELKKEPDSTIEDTGEKPTAISKEEREDAKLSNTKES